MHVLKLNSTQYRKRTNIWKCSDKSQSAVFFYRELATRNALLIFLLTSQQILVALAFSEMYHLNVELTYFSCISRYL